MARRIRSDLMDQLGVDSKTMADVAGVSVATIYGWEKGNMPRYPRKEFLTYKMLEEYPNLVSTLKYAKTIFGVRGARVHFATLTRLGNEVDWDGFKLDKLVKTKSLASMLPRTFYLPDAKTIKSAFGSSGQFMFKRAGKQCLSL